MANPICKANLRFKNGDVVTVEVTRRNGNVDWPGTWPGLEQWPWPHELRYTRKRLVDFRMLSRPVDDDKPVQTVDDVATFHIDRATFDPDRAWQNYVEAE